MRRYPHVLCISDIDTDTATSYTTQTSMDENKAKVGKTFRFNTRIFDYQRDFIKSEVKKSKGKVSEGDVLRTALDEYITKRKKK